MNQELEIEDIGNQETVIKNLQLADGLLIILPMPVVVILTFLSAFTEPTTSVSMGFGIAVIFFSFFFCAAYGILALILSLLICRNRTFRILLVTISLWAVGCFCFWLFR